MFRPFRTIYNYGNQAKHCRIFIRSKTALLQSARVRLSQVVSPNRDPVDIRATISQFNLSFQHNLGVHIETTLLLSEQNSLPFRRFLFEAP